jgi:hypothetical protein
LGCRNQRFCVLKIFFYLFSEKLHESVQLRADWRLGVGGG